MSTITSGNTLLSAITFTGDTTGNLVYIAPNTHIFQAGVSNTLSISANSSVFTGNVTAGNVIASNVTVSGTITGNVIGNITGNVTGNIIGTTTLTNPTITGNTGSISSINTFGFKNRIINGAMVIDQRASGASSTPSSSGTSYDSCDRWMSLHDVGSKYSIQQVSDAPAGFNYSLKLTSLSAYTLGTNEVFGVKQNIEGFNVADLGFGTANAKTVTISFWVKSSLTGTFGGSLQNNDYTRGYPFGYTISSANTWTQVSVTIPGDTSGGWLINNGIGFMVSFSIGSGPGRSNTANVWTGTQYTFAPTGAVSVVGTSSATWQITGVQLEVGTQATSFDYRDYGRELFMCQRYFCSSFQDGVAPYNYVSGSEVTQGYYTGMVIVGSADIRTSAIFFPASMRTSPSITFYKTTNSSTNGLWAYFNGSGWATASTTVTDGLGNKGFNADMSISGGSTGNAFIVSGMWAAAAEL